MRFHPFIVIVLTPGIALAQATPPLSADEAVALAVKQNPRLSAAARELAAARYGLQSARAPADPSLTFTPGITGLGGTDEELLFQQPLELNGTRSARTGLARSQLRLTQAESVGELRQVVFETREVYYELSRAQELRSLSEEVLRIGEEFDRITRRQVEVGTRPGIEQTQTSIEVTRAKQQLSLAESRVTVTQAALNTLMGRAPSEPIGPLPALAPTVEPVDAEAVMRQALAARTEIAGAEARREAFQQEARLTRAEGRPDLVPQFRAGSLTRGVRDTGVGLGITLPLFDYGSRRNRIRQSEEAARAQTDRIAAIQNQVRQEVEQAVTRVLASEAVLRDYRQGVLDQARTLLDASRRGFESGLTSLVQLLEAERTYRGVVSEYTNALADYAQARAELERAAGHLPPGALQTVLPANASDTRQPK